MPGRTAFVLFAALALFTALVLAGCAGTPPALDADLQLSHAQHLHDTAPRTTGRGLQLRVSYSHEGDGLGLRASARLRWNDAYRSPAYSAEARQAYRFSADWRELVLSVPVRGWSVSAGLQQEVWGRADNLRIVDLVNPVDQRDFVLPDLADQRIAVPMLRAGRRLGDWNVALVYLPWFVPSRAARPGSEYAFTMAGETQPTVLRDKRPRRRLRSGEVGLQLSRSGAGLDFSGFLFATRDDDPVCRLVGIDPNGLPVLQREYHRQLMAGVSVARPLAGGLVLRNEWAFVPRATRMAQRPASQGLARGATLTGLLGLDYLWRDWMLSAQVTDRHLRHWQPDELLPRHSRLYTLSITGSALAGRLDTRLVLSRYAARADGHWLQWKTTWKPDDRWAYTLGADLFSGAPQGVFGQFAAKDRLYVDVLYRF